MFVQDGSGVRVIYNEIKRIKTKEIKNTIQDQYIGIRIYFVTDSANKSPLEPE